MEDTSDYLDLFDHDLELYFGTDLEENKNETSSSNSKKKSDLTPAEDGVGYSLPQSELSIQSPQFHQMEEQKMVFKMSFDKLRKIYDSDACLCRWVVLRNTRKTLQREIENTERLASTKRSFDDMNYCDVEDILSQLCTSPTMLAPIDNDEDEPTPKRIKKNTSLSNHVLVYIE